MEDDVITWKEVVMVIIFHIVFWSFIFGYVEPRF